MWGGIRSSGSSRTRRWWRGARDYGSRRDGASGASTGDIFAELKKALSGHTPARLPGLPPFTAGAVGFFAYDVVRQIEKLPALAKDELGVPDACLMFFDQVLAFDHVKKEIHLMVTADLTREARRGCV